MRTLVLLSRLSGNSFSALKAGAQNTDGLCTQLTQNVLPGRSDLVRVGEQLEHLMEAGGISSRSLPPSAAASIATQVESGGEGLAVAIARWLSTTDLGEAQGSHELEQVVRALIQANYPGSTKLLYDMTETSQGFSNICKLHPTLVFQITAAYKAHSWTPNQTAAIRHLAPPEAAQLIHTIAMHEGYPSMPCTLPLIEATCDVIRTTCGSAQGFSPKDCIKVLRSLSMLKCPDDVKRSVGDNAMRCLDDFNLIDMVQLMHALAYADMNRDAEHVAGNVARRVGYNYNPSGYVDPECLMHVSLAALQRAENDAVVDLVGGVAAVRVLTSRELLEALPGALGATVFDSQVDADELLAMMTLHIASPIAYPDFIKILSSHLTTLLQGGATYSSPLALVEALSTVTQAQVQTPRLFAEVSKHLQNALDTLPPARLGCVAAAYATSNYYCGRLFRELETFLIEEDKRSKLDGMTIATLLYAMAEFNHPVPRETVMLAAISVMTDWVDESSPADIAAKASTLAWSVGVLMHKDKHESAAQLINNMAGILTKLKVVGHMEWDGLSGLLWGMTSVLHGETVDPVVAELFVEAADHCISVLKRDTRQVHNVGIMMWCFVTTLRRAEDVEHVASFVSRVAEEVIGDFDLLLSGSMSEMVYMLSCFLLHAEDSAEEIFTLLEGYLMENKECLHLMSAPETVALLEGFLNTGAGSDELLSMLFNHSVSHEVAGTFTSSAASSLAVMASECSACPPDLLDALRHILDMHPLDEEDLASDPNAPLLQSILGDLPPSSGIPLALRPHRRKVPEGVSLSAQLPSWPYPSDRELSDLLVVPYKVGSS
eukprot:TRINITY_DN10401_c0_g1_i1.p1 TRINITY_DN10401_c0_g1~~TRINITY_DN10401_c0_g1_i1.p1  ORF type:complete len:830 (+),score=200.21 TRINITY_DN10401_c0_g1_i1:75-2564(+)